MGANDDGKFIIMMKMTRIGYDTLGWGQLQIDEIIILFENQKNK